MKKKTLQLALVLSVLFSPAAMSADSSALAEKARALLSAGKAQDSYALLSKGEEEFADDVEFNYLLGISALDSGHFGAAVFAFERALALDPNHALARAELGRTMMVMGEFEGARKELAQVRSMNPPPEAAKVIDTTLAEIDRREQALKTDRAKAIFAGYLEAELGYDSNINTAPDTSTIFIPLLNVPGTLSGFARAQDSVFLGINGGIQVYKPVSDNVAVFGSADLKARYNHNESDFLPISLYGSAGVKVSREKDQFSFGLTQFTYYINQYRNNDNTGVFGQWQREFSGQDVGGLFAQYSRNDTPLVPALGTDLYMAGGFWTHAFLRKGDPLLSMLVYAGDDREQGDNPTVGRTLYGGKVSLEYMFSDRIKLLGGLGVQYSRYGGTNVFFMTKREDTRYDLNLGIAYKPSRNWTITPQFLYTSNDSTVGLNEWTRTQALVNVRRDFF